MMNIQLDALRRQPFRKGVETIMAWFDNNSDDVMQSLESTATFWPPKDLRYADAKRRLIDTKR